MKIDNLYAGSWRSNCYLLVADGTDGKRHCAIVDPSAPASIILDRVSMMGAVLDLIIMTHGHFDHIYELNSLKDATGAEICIHRDDAEMLSDGQKNAYFLFLGKDLTTYAADRLLEHGDELKIGRESLKVISTPGHSKGSICLLGDGFMITGDTLFAEGYGRCDLYGGDRRALVSSLLSLKNYDPTLIIYPGHGESETLCRALQNIYI